MGIRFFKPEKGPEKIGDILSKLFVAKGWGRKQERLKLEKSWAEAAGEAQAKGKERRKTRGRGKTRKRRGNRQRRGGGRGGWWPTCGNSGGSASPARVRADPFEGAFLH